MPLLGVRVLRETVDFHARRANSVVHDAAQFAQLVDVVERLDVERGASKEMPRDIPRVRTMNPVALATIDCSKLIFEPSAKDVTIAGFWPHLSAKPFCVAGFR